MKLSEFTKSDHAIFKGLKTIEHHDGGTSVYGFSHNIVETEGHARVAGGHEVHNPADNGFSMALNVYDSAMDFAEMSRNAKDIVAAYNNERYRAHLRLDNNPEWYGGFRNVDDGYKMICDGWEEGAKKAVLTLGNIKIPEIDGIESMRRTLIFSDCGEVLNIDQAMAGNWEKAWQTCKRIRSGVSRVLSVAIPFGGNCDKNSEQMFWNGAQGMIITDILEDKGYRVQLYGVHVAIERAEGRTWDMDVVRLKNSDEPLRMDSLAAVVAHAGVFRTAGFMSILSKPMEVDYRLGSCQEQSVKPCLDAIAKLGLMHPGTIVLDGGYTKEAATANIIKFFERMKNGEYANS
jgi:hypothetical protein